MSLEAHIDLIADWLAHVCVESAQIRVDDLQSLNAKKDRGGALLERGGDLARTAHHEAAHAVVGHACGLRIERALVRADATGCVMVERCEDGVFAHILSDLAGLSFEVIAGADERRQLVLRSSHDVLQARLRIDAAKLSIRLCVTAACCTVVSNLQAIRRVAAVLAVDGEIDAQMIAALCGKPQ